MDSYWAVFEILPYTIFFIAVIVCVVTVSVSSCHKFLSQIYHSDSFQPKKTISRILAAYTVLCFGLTGVFAFQDFLYQRTTECIDRGGLHCYVITNGTIGSVHNCSEISNENSVVCYEVVLDVLQGLGRIGSYTGLLFFFIAIPHAFKWKKRAIAFSTALVTVAAIVCLVSTIVQLAVNNILLAIQPIMFSISFFALAGLFGVMLVWIGCGFDP